MSGTIAGTPFTVFDKTEVTSIIRSHHVYREVWEAAIGKMLEATSDDRQEAKEYDDAVGLYKKDFLVGHIPIEILSYVSISSIKIQGKKSTDNWKTTTGNRTCCSSKVTFITNNKRSSEVLENELVKRKNKFPTLTLKFKKKGV